MGWHAFWKGLPWGSPHFGRGNHGVALGIGFVLGFVCEVGHPGWPWAGQFFNRGGRVAMGWPGHPSHPIGDIYEELEPLFFLECGRFFLCVILVRTFQISVDGFKGIEIRVQRSHFLFGSLGLLRHRGLILDSSRFQTFYDLKEIYQNQKSARVRTCGR